MGSEPKPKIPRDLFIIDEAVRDEYRYIEDGDSCFYIWERMSQLWKPGGERPDYTQYPVNGLISNLQILPSLRSTQPRRYYWKERAIAYAASALAALIPEVWREGATFVPIPPSKPTNDPEYDDRLLVVLKAVRPKLPDMRPLIVLDEDCGFDSKQKGLSPAERQEHYSIDKDYADPDEAAVGRTWANTSTRAGGVPRPAGRNSRSSSAMPARGALTVRLAMMDLQWPATTPLAR